ncbi:MAG TPA: VOC family protein [Acidimicrobiales bacterium]|nr:VOC family protein [Acidimicrobiales bacterium]
MSLPRRLSAVTLGTADLPRLRSFYSAGLGWEEVAGSDDNWVAYVAGGVVLSLFPSEELAAESGVDQGQSGAGSSRGDMFTLGCNVESAAKVDEVYRAWLAAGAQVGAEPEDRSWGGRSGYVLDPDGNAWEIAWAPGIVFGERGEIVGFGGA